MIIFQLLSILKLLTWNKKNAHEFNGGEFMCKLPSKLIDEVTKYPTSKGCVNGNYCNYVQYNVYEHDHSIMIMYECLN